MHKPFPLLIAAMCLLASGGCQSVGQLSVDYMLPAEINFPDNMRRVAVVNNMPQSPEPYFKVEDSRHGDGNRHVSVTHKVYDGDARVATLALAQGLADGNYFDEVVICDSALRAADVTPRETTLTRAEVRQLIQRLDVDFIVALENVQIKSRRQVGYSPLYDAYVGMLDVNAYAKACLYFPSRNGAAATLSCADSIYWEEGGASLGEANARLISEGDMVVEASGFAGRLPVERLLPHWQTATRYLFKGGSVAMRDAAVYADEGLWAEAVELWELAYRQSKRSRQKMRTAYNVAVGYEMQDSISKAIQWARKAQDAAAQVDKLEEKVQENQNIYADKVPNYTVVSLYIAELEKRKQSIQQLDMQMERFIKP